MLCRSCAELIPSRRRQNGLPVTLTGWLSLSQLICTSCGEPVDYRSPSDLFREKLMQLERFGLAVDPEAAPATDDGTGDADTPTQQPSPSPAQ